MKTHNWVYNTSAVDPKLLHFSKGTKFQNSEVSQIQQKKYNIQSDAFPIKWAHIYNIQNGTSFPNELHLRSYLHTTLKYNKVSL